MYRGIMSDIDSVAESSRKWKLCPHCNEYVSRATYFRHLALMNSSAKSRSENDLDSTESSGDESIAAAASYESNGVSGIISTDIDGSLDSLKKGS